MATTASIVVRPANTDASPNRSGESLTFARTGSGCLNRSAPLTDYLDPSVAPVSCHGVDATRGRPVTRLKARDLERARMSVEGLCQVCESAPGDHACERCGAVVCDRHFDDEYAMCVNCVAEVAGGDHDRDDDGGGRQFDDEDVPGEYRF
jgi:hypothetical protein